MLTNLHVVPLKLVLIRKKTALENIAEPWKIIIVKIRIDEVFILMIMLILCHSAVSSNCFHPDMNTTGAMHVNWKAGSVLIIKYVAYLVALVMTMQALIHITIWNLFKVSHLLYGADVKV